MADTDAKAVDTAAEKKKLKEEKKKLDAEQKQQKKEARARAKEIATQQAKLDEDVEGGGFSSFIVTVVIVIVWLAIIAVLVKLDVGGFGSNVLTPILKDVPVVNMILPEGGGVTDTTDTESYGGYTSLEDAVAQIGVLQQELEKAQSENANNADEISLLKAEVERLQTFEDNQVEFERVKLQFYEDVVYAENGPGADAYVSYYETMDPTTAEYLYKQVIQQIEASTEVQEYAAAYSSMKPSAAAKIFEEMTDDLSLAAKILDAMSDEDRGDILGAMDAEIAAKITKIMEPDS
jgi:flagellar motility protein MotE (MotC chaperone)